MNPTQSTSTVGAHDSEEPGSAHAALIAVFSSAVILGLQMTRRHHRLPRRLRASDLVLLGIATHKLSRLVALDRVTTPLRAPFAAEPEATGAGEVEESPRGRGLRHALGELVTCPYCLAPWLAGAFVLGMLNLPRRTRVIAGLLNVVALSDFLNQQYAHLKERNHQAD